MTETPETITFEIHVRIGSNGAAVCVTSQEIENGASLDDIWEDDDDVTTRDAVIAVTAPVPVAPVPDATLTLGAPVAPGAVVATA